MTNGMGSQIWGRAIPRPFGYLLAVALVASFVVGSPLGADRAEAQTDLPNDPVIVTQGIGGGGVDVTIWEDVVQHQGTSNCTRTYYALFSGVTDEMDTVSAAVVDTLFGVTPVATAENPRDEVTQPEVAGAPTPWYVGLASVSSGDACSNSQWANRWQLPTEVTIRRSPPIVDVTYNQGFGGEPYEVLFGGNTYDRSPFSDAVAGLKPTANADLVYEWDFGEHGTSTERSPIVQFPGPGAYPASLTVTDETGLQSSAELDVDIDFVPPELDLAITMPATVTVDEDVAATVTVTNLGPGALDEVVFFVPESEPDVYDYAGPFTVTVTEEVPVGGSVAHEFILVPLAEGEFDLDFLVEATCCAGDLIDAGATATWTAGPPLPTAIVVNDNGDEPDDDPDDDACDIDPDTSGPQCTLRAAIEVANARAGVDTVSFDMAAPATISPSTALPDLVEGVVLDATTNPSGRVTVDGAFVGAADGLNAVGGAVTITGLAFVQWEGAAIRLGGTGGHLVSDNWIGVTAGGAAASNDIGVVIESAASTLTGNRIAANGDKQAAEAYATDSEAGTTAAAWEAQILATIGAGVYIGQQGLNAVVNGNTFGGSAALANSADLWVSGVAGPLNGTAVTDNTMSHALFSVLALGDVDGLQITGNTIGSGAILAGGTNGLTISGNNINSRDVGLITYATVDTAVASNTFVFTDLPVLDVSSFRLVVNGNRFEGTTWGVTLLGAQQDTDVRVTNNTFTADESEFGVLAAGVDGMTVSGNTISENVIGMFVVASRGSTFAGNTITDGGLGMLLVNTGDSTVTSNTVTGNVAGVLVIDDSPTDNDLEQAQLSDIPAQRNDLGILIDRPGLGTSLAALNGLSPLDFDVDSLYAPRPAAEALAIAGNTISDNDLGLVVGGRARGLVVGLPGAANRVTGNRYFGIVLGGDDPPVGVSIRGNVVAGNAYESLPLYPGSRIPDISIAAEDPVVWASTLQPLANDLGDADIGPNDGQNHPIITTVAPTASGTTISGTIDSSPSTLFLIDVYGTAACHRSGHGGADTHFGTVQVSTDAVGQAAWSLDARELVPGEVVTATATSTSAFDTFLDSTSEFSPCAALETLTTTTTDVSVGDTTVPTETTDGFEIGDQVIIGEEPFFDVGYVVGFGSLILDRPLRFDHPAGTTVAKVETPADLPPSCPPVAIETIEETTTTVSLVNCVDEEVANLTATVAPGDEPANGVLTAAGPMSWAYTPATGFVGTDGFTIVVRDAAGGETSVAVAIAVAADPSTSSYRAKREEMIADLEAALPTGSRRDDRRIRSAIRSLERGLRDRYWADDDTLAHPAGHAVFGGDAVAVHQLSRVRNWDGAASIVEQLVDADRDMATEALDRAQAVVEGGLLLHWAGEKLQRGDRALAAGDPVLAVTHYGAAWSLAGWAIAGAS